MVGMFRAATARYNVRWWESEELIVPFPIQSAWDRFLELNRAFAKFSVDSMVTFSQALIVPQSKSLEHREHPPIHHSFL